MDRLGLKQFAVPAAPVLSTVHANATLPASVVVTQPRQLHRPVDEVPGDCDDLILFMNDMVGGNKTSSPPAGVSGSESSNGVTDNGGIGSEDRREEDIAGFETIVFGPREAESALPHVFMASTIMPPNQDSVVSTITTIVSARLAATQSLAEEPDSITGKTTSSASTQGLAGLAIESSTEPVKAISPSSRLSVQDTAYDESRSSDEDSTSPEDVEALKASHRKEIEQIKAGHIENLQILNNDLQKQKEKTQSADSRAGKANNELRTSRAQQRDLKEELATTKSQAQ
jgi:hypothetical protein